MFLLGRNKTSKRRWQRALVKTVATHAKWLKEVSKRENFVFGGGLSEMLL